MKRCIAYLFIIPILIGIHPDNYRDSLFAQNAQVIINYSFEPAVQHFVVPPSVSTITVTIGGAQGAGALGGKGASFTGICPVIENHVLSVVVGQQGAFVGWQGGDTNGGSGGGASWVYDSNLVLYDPSGVTGLIAVAAGGGGGGFYVVYGGLNSWSFYAGGPGGVDLNNNASTTGTYSGSGGTFGNGGTALYAGGGAGWLSDGQGGEGYSGTDEANHFSINSSNYIASGGFGGGGGTHGFQLAGHDGVFGGGGGGYNGGGSGYGGGGGGSYLNGTLVGEATASDTGNGFVTISYIPPLIQVIDIYPNPNSGVFTINGLRQEQIIEIYNCLGQKLQNLQATNTLIQPDLSAYANGVYIVVIRNADGSQVWQTKLVKLK